MPAQESSVASGRFVVPMVPPNLTGDLHLGHALMLAVQDSLIRTHRQRGEPVAFLPGTDHAGIGMYTLVLADQEFRPELPLEERLHAWAELHRARLRRQMELLGLLCDWDRMTYTLDEHYQRLVREVFGRLAEEALVYREQRVVAWCPACRTTISDMETEPASRQRVIALVHLEAAGSTLVVETEAPELLWGVAALQLPDADGSRAAWAGGSLATIADGRLGPGPELLVPGHDPSHLAVARDLDLEVREVLDGSGRSLLPEAPGLSREQLREWTIRRLGLPTAVRSVPIQQCGRCGEELFPRLSWQWFLRMRPLATPLVQALEDGEVELSPPGARSDALGWLDRVEDWCISRQIPWGQIIPARVCAGCGWWTTEDRDTCVKCRGPTAPEVDVFDTWFNCALWPLAVARWPNGWGDGETLYPSSVLTTGKDILFFWLVRALALCRHVAGRLPATRCYLHGLVLDEHGRKMSKSWGNTVRIEDAVRRHGADVVRAVLLSRCRGAEDVTLADPVSGGQAATARMLDELASATQPSPDSELDALDHWCARAALSAGQELAGHVDRFSFARAVGVLTDFAQRRLRSYIDIRRKQAARGGREFAHPSVTAAVAALVEPIMPVAAGRLLELSGSPTPDVRVDEERAGATEALLRAVGELDALRGAIGLNTVRPVVLHLPDDIAKVLAAEPWVGQVSRFDLRLEGPTAGTVRWQLSDVPGAHLYMAEAYREVLRREGMRRLRKERERERRLVRRLRQAAAGESGAAEDAHERLERRRAARLERIAILHGNLR